MPDLRDLTPRDPTPSAARARWGGKLRRRAAALARDRSGGVALLFGLSILPLTFAVGATIDYSRAADSRAEMQRAVDAAAIAVARDGDRKTEAELRAIANALLDFHMARQPNFTLTRRTVEIGTRNVRVTLEGEQSTAFSQIMGQGSRIPINVEGRGAWGKRRIEVALVLDNTGSMASSNKMTELKKAINDPGGLIEILRSVQREPDMVKVGVVPFDVQVRVDPSVRNEPWLDFASASVPATLPNPIPVVGGGSIPPSWVPMRTTRGAWTGCISDRPQPMDANDAGPTIPPQVIDPRTLYPAATCHNGGGLATLLPMTTDLNAVKAKVSSMNPNGNTNVAIGFQWGMAMLSPGVPLTQASAASDPDVEKFLILLTDGDNTQSAWTYDQVQRKYRPDQAALDGRTRAACTEAKQPDKKITVYTIRVIDGNANLLRDCATNPSFYFDVRSASQLSSVFKAIADQITNIRLTQ